MSVFRSFHRHDIDISSFHEAACTCNIDALRILKKHRNRVSKTYSHPQYHNHNTSLLHTAAAAGHPSLVDYLCRECLADIELGDTNGDTPLHLASRLNHYPVVKVLLNFGANPHSRNKFNETPLDLTQTHSETNRALLSSLQEDTFYNINLGNFNLGNSGKAIFIQATGQNEISTKTTQPKRKTKIQQFQPHYTWLNSTNKIKKGTVSTSPPPIPNNVSHARCLGSLVK